MTFQAFSLTSMQHHWFEQAKSKVEWDSDADIFSQSDDSDGFDADVKQVRKFKAKWVMHFLFFWAQAHA